MAKKKRSPPRGRRVRTRKSGGGFFGWNMWHADDLGPGTEPEPEPEPESEPEPPSTDDTDDAS